MRRIRKVLITEFGDESKLSVVDSEIAEPRPGEVQLGVEYSALSGADINMRKGKYPFQKKAPLTPGYSVVGRIVAVGPKGGPWQVGQRVACLSKYDGQAERVNLPAKFLVPVPDGVDLKQAVALVVDWVTGYQMVTRVARVQTGQSVFVHGMSGAVGRAVMAFAQRQGATVYGTASERNHDALKELGAVPFVYTDKGWMAAMKAQGNVDAVFDPLGFESFAESYSVLKRGGILVGYGLNLLTLQGKAPRPFLPAYLGLLAKNLLFWRGKRTRFYGLNRASRHFISDLETLLDMLQAKQIAVPIKAVYPMEAIQQAHRDWASGGGMGSIVIEVLGEVR